MLEVVLALGLVVLSAGLLVAGLAFVVVVTLAIVGAAHSFSPGVAAALMAGSGGLLFQFGGPVMRAIWNGLAAIWKTISNLLPLRGAYAAPDQGKRDE